MSRGSDTAPLSRHDLSDVAKGLHVAAHTLEEEARSEGPDSYRFDYLVATAARFRRVRARAMRAAR